ncbi:MAG: TM2 domain-containing protein [Cyanobacteria bacterium]|nr:TM2 domain-containing protein [Cyanobacteriota bacterium]
MSVRWSREFDRKPTRQAFQGQESARITQHFTGGIHRFYLGYTGIGVAQLVLTLAGLVTCGLTSLAAWVWGIVDGIMILTGSINKDAQGNLLKD